MIYARIWSVRLGKSQCECQQEFPPLLSENEVLFRRLLSNAAGLLQAARPYVRTYENRSVIDGVQSSKQPVLEQMDLFVKQLQEMGLAKAKTSTPSSHF